MKLNPEKPKSLSLVLRRSVPKLLLILTASVPAIVIPSIVIGRSKENLKYVEGELVSSKLNEPLSQSGRFAVGQKGNAHFVHLVGEEIPEERPAPVQQILLDESVEAPEELPDPIYSIPPNENVELPEEKGFDEVVAEQKEWEKTVPLLDETPANIDKIPKPPEKIDLKEGAQNSEETFLEIAYLKDPEIAAEDQPNNAAPEQESTTPSATDPRSILKIFPLRPENYGQTEKKELEDQKTTGSQSTPQPKDDKESPASPSQEAPPLDTVDETKQNNPVAPKTVEETLQQTKPSAPVEEKLQAAPVEDQQITPPTEKAALSPKAPEPAAKETEARVPQNVLSDVPPQNAGEQKGYLANYTNLDIKEYIRFISRITNKNFIFNENDLNFTISMISEKRSTPEELIGTLMQQLRIHGLAVIEEGDSFIIHTNPEVNSPATVLPRSPGEPIPDDVQIITQVFRLNVIAPSQAVTILKPLLSSQAVMEPLDDAGILTLTDLRMNIEKVKDLLIQLDFPSSGLDVSHYRSEFVNAETLASLGEKVLTPIADGKEIRLIPLKDSNMLFIISTPILVRRAVEFFTALDKEIRYNTGNGGVGGIYGSNGGRAGGGSGGSSGSSGSGVEAGVNGQTPQSAIQQELAKQQALNDALKSTQDLNETLQNTTEAQAGGAITEFDYYKLEYRKGDQIQAALSQIADSLIKVKSNEDGGNDLYNAISSVQWIEASNTLVFTGTVKANEKIKNLIRDLDTPNQQVLIEMLLLDTSIDKSYSFGVDWGSRFGGPNAAGSQAFLSPESPLPSGLDTNLTPDFLNASNLARSAGFTLGVIGRTISCNGLTFSELGALITAIHTSDIGKVILNPKIVVEENSTAEIFVGLNIPFKTQSIANDFGTILTNNFEYRDIGARMTVTPIINRNGIITLEIEQELSTLISSTTSVITSSFFEISSVASGAGPTTRKSNSKTTLFVPNGHFVILSGMIQDESERIRTQVPCLGGIPVLGGAFSQKSNTEQNRNLMIFIRPSLINTEDEMTYFTKREQDIYDQKCREKDLWKYEIEEALDFLNLNPDSCCK